LFPKGHSLQASRRSSTNREKYAQLRDGVQVSRNDVKRILDKLRISPTNRLEKMKVDRAGSGPVRVLTK